MAKIGSVNVLWKTVDIYAFNGDIVDVAFEPSSESHSARVIVRNPLSHETCEVGIARRSAEFHVSHMATVLLGEATDHRRRLISVHNHATRQVQTLREDNNDVACLPFYDLCAILAVAAIALGLTVGMGVLSWALVLAGAGYIGFTWLCQKRLIDGIAKIMRSYTPDFGVVPKTSNHAPEIIPEVVPEIVGEVPAAVAVFQGQEPAEVR